MNVFEKWLEKEGKSGALYNLRASDEFSKLMKDRKSETFENGLKPVNILAQIIREIL